MKHIGIFDAKTHLSSLVDEIETKGGEIVITRHGRPVAKLVRADKLDRLPPEQVEKRRQALKELREIGSRLGINATHEEIKAWITEGRR